MLYFLFIIKASKTTSTTTTSTTASTTTSISNRLFLSILLKIKSGPATFTTNQFKLTVKSFHN